MIHLGDLMWRLRATTIGLAAIASSEPAPCGGCPHAPLDPRSMICRGCTLGAPGVPLPILDGSRAVVISETRRRLRDVGARLEKLVE